MTEIRKLCRGACTQRWSGLKADLQAVSSKSYLRVSPLMMTLPPVSQIPKFKVYIIALFGRLTQQRYRRYNWVQDSMWSNYLHRRELGKTAVIPPRQSERLTVQRC